MIKTFFLINCEQDLEVAKLKLMHAYIRRGKGDFGAHKEHLINLGDIYMRKFAANKNWVHAFKVCILLHFSS